MNEGRKRKQTFGTVLNPRKCVCWVVVGPNPVSFLRGEVFKLTASLPIDRSGSAKCCRSSAVCREVYILNEKRHASTALGWIYFQYKVLVRFTVMMLRLDVAREAFERHLRILNRRTLTIELRGDVLPSVVEVILNCEIVWFPFSSWIYLTSYWFPVRRHLDFS